MVLIVIESVIITFSVLSIIPFADYLIDPSLNNPSKITIFFLKFLNYFSLNGSYVVFATIFVLSNLLRSCMNLLIKFMVLKIRYEIQKSFSREILKKIFLSKWNFFNNLSFGKITNTFIKEIEYIGTASRSIGEIFSSFLSIVTFLIIPLTIDTTLTILLILGCFLLGLPFLILNKTSRNLGKARTESGNTYYAKLIETLQASKLIMGFGLGKKQVNSNIILMENYFDKDLVSQFVNLISIYLFKPLAIILLILVFGIKFDLGNLPAYAAIFWSLYGALPLLAQMFNSTVVINNYQPSYNQINEIIERAENHFENKGSIKISSINDDIIFKDVDFSYGEVKILKNINFKLKKNKITILTGESGAGKSSILDILMSLQKKKSGYIFINNHEIDTLDLIHYRKQIGYVPQDPVLFFASIKENLLWSNEKSSDKEIIDALKLANAYEFISQFPKRQDTQVGEKGTEISGGQRQRIALARAIIRKPKLLILDEPTSSIDMESQLLIKKTLKKISSSTTILMATHDKSMIDVGDEIYKVSNGKILNENEVNV